MRQRTFCSPAVLVACTTVVFLVSSCAGTEPAEEDAVSSLRTPWGDPDLQGIWNNFTITPLERPADLADQEFLSAEEAEALREQAVDRNRLANAPSTVRTEPLPVGGRRFQRGRLQQLLD